MLHVINELDLKEESICRKPNRSTSDIISQEQMFQGFCELMEEWKCSLPLKKKKKKPTINQQGERAIKLLENWVR